MLRAYLSLSASLVFCFGTALGSIAQPASQAERQQMLNVPLHFEPNVGQADEKVRFLARGQGYALALTTREAILKLPVRGVRGEAIRLRFVNGSPVNVRAEAPLTGKVNYLIGARSRWKTNVPTYAKVRYQGVYRGIDAVFYGKQRLLEYDLVVAPGAEAKQIVMEIEGARLRLAENGDLVLITRAGELRQHRPVVYQRMDDRRQTVAGEYVLLGQNRIGFRIGEYDRERELVIDPVLSYSTYLHGNHIDDASGVAVDGSGNAYVIGTTYWGFPTKNAFQENQFGRDAFVTKFNANGSGLIYSTYIGGSSDVDLGIAIGVDRFGQAYAVGQTESTDFPTTPGAFQQVWKGGRDVFVTKLSASGSTAVYSTLIGGVGDDLALAMALDSQQRVYVAGSTCGFDYPVTPNAFQQVNKTDGCGRPSFHTGLLTRLSADGAALSYSTYLGGSFGERIWGVAVDSTFHAYVTGGVESVDFPTTPGAFQATSPAGADAFVTKFSADGSDLVWSTYLGGDSTDTGFAIAVDQEERPYVTGSTTGGFPVTAGAFQSTMASTDSLGTDAFVTKLWKTGAGLVYSTYLGGSRNDRSTSIAVDAKGRAHVAGTTVSIDFPVKDAIQPSSTLGDAFITKLTWNGQALEYSTYLGGSGGDSASSIRVGPDGNAYIAGFTHSSDFPTTPGAFDRTSGSESDAWVAKISDTPAATCAPPDAGLSVRICEPGDGATVSTPVQIVASANPGSSTMHRMNVWVDGQKRHEELGVSTIDTEIDMSVGTHRVTVQGVNNDGAVFNATIHITVQ